MSAFVGARIAGDSRRRRIARGAGSCVALFAAAIVLAACGAPVEDNEQVQNRGSDKDNWWDALPRPEWAEFERIPQDQDWFEVYRVAPSVYAIYEPGQFEEVISFLIEGEERALLFDSGLGIGDMRRVVDALTDREVVVLNSHTHYDHTGGNWQFDTIYAVDTPFTRGNAQGSSPEAVAEFVQEGWIWKALPEGFSRAEYRTRPFEISRYVVDGEKIELGGRTLEVMATPGHAPDSICLLDRENRMLYTGDTFYLAPLYTHLEGSDFDRFAESAGRIAGLAGEIDVMMTAHNVPVVDSRYAVALGRAFDDIRAGRADDYTLTDGLREYHFDGFSVIVDDPGSR